ncbi:DNA breaking-rejoining enzyme [Mycena metata]|uniref:DNA breaking-rejoining enzyme n=1 Tax=Mycena metata TaxID=1033252 RepID=A0AAD7GU15_9AGAR|nr:DNA breaking-rejoining enzyme [Mycena metata]
MATDGTMRSPEFIRLSFSNAQKMRAAASWNFAQVNNQGNEPWRKSDVTGLWTGNPSVSPVVSKYMTSLKRRKVQSGEVANSTRAITPEKKWEGPRMRALCWLAYLLAFHCLLRVDEVVNIQVHEVHPIPTHSFTADIQPFCLWMMPEEDQHLCPVRAYARWVELSGLKEGYLFRKVDTSSELLEMFRNHLLDVNVDPYPYGTHSFRRGGCQYLHYCRRWTIGEICQWGGWSIEFSSLTIVKYLISPNDSPRVDRMDFFNPNRPLQLKCPYCGRSCNCA